MQWMTYGAVTFAVVLVGLAVGVSLPLLSLRRAAWGYGPFAIGLMAAMPAVGILLGAWLTGPLASRTGSRAALQLCLLLSALSLLGVLLFPSYGVWLLLRLLLGLSLTIVFVLGESWINQLVVDAWRGRLVALYGTAFAVSQLSGPLLLGVLGSEGDGGFWVAIGLLLLGPLLLIGREGAPQVERQAMVASGLLTFCRAQPAIAWAMVLFAAFEALILTLLPVYLLQEAFPQPRVLQMTSAVVVGNALLQLPIGLLADRLPRIALFRACTALLLLSSLALPLLLHSVLIWPLLLLFGASAGGLYTLALILIGERYRDDALVRANAHVAQLWGLGCLVGPLLSGAGSQWLSSHALPWSMALGALVLLLLAARRAGFARYPSA